jgi:DNA repair protein RecO (recombination protein O)
MSRRVESQRAWVLHQRDYRDSSRIVEFFTQQHGRTSAVAKGIKNAKSSLRGVLQPFTPLVVSWAGKGELKTLVSAETHGRPSGLVGDQLYCGFYLNEVLLRVLAKEDQYSELFEWYSLALSELAAGQPIEVVLRLFEKRLLDALGYGVSFHSEGHNNMPVLPEQEYRYHPQAGLIRSNPNQPGVKGDALLALENETLTPMQAKQLSPMMRELIQQHIGNKPLNSRALWLSAKKLQSR